MRAQAVSRATRSPIIVGLIATTTDAQKLGFWRLVIASCTMLGFCLGIVYGSAHD